MAERPDTSIVLVDVRDLRHIEGFSHKRVEWLTRKIASEGVWGKPVALDDEHNLVLDGQHRMEAALKLGLKKVPAVKFRYADVEVWSLRPTYSFDWKLVVKRSLSGDIYPYKTVKHRFPKPMPACQYSLDELR
jgi:hypothetical protein